MRTDVRTGGSLVVGGAVTAVLLVLAVADAGFSKALWLPVAAFVVALALAVALGLPDVARNVPTATRVAVLAFFAFAAWSFLSIAWADARADAWDAANRTLFYATLYALVALWPWRPSVGAGVLGAFAVGIALVGGATLSAALRSDDLDSFFVTGFAEPTGYHNANAALFLMAFWPALLFASRRETPAAVRPLLLASACLLLELAILSESRGSLIAFPASALVFFAIVPTRLRALVALAPVAAAAFLARDPLLGVFSAVRQDEGAAAVRGAATAVAVSVTAVAVAGLVLVLADRRFSVPRRLHVLAGAAAIALVASVLLVGGVVLALSDPVRRGQAAWANFKQYHPEQEMADNHFASGLGSNRYDFWRVSLAEFADAPLHGIGADNFAVPYLRDRRSTEEPLYPHSIVFGVLSQTGLVGVALLSLFAAAAVRAAWRGRTVAPHGGALVAVGLTVATYFGIHAAGDWLWELPGVAAPALVALAIPAGAARRDPTIREGQGPALLIGGVTVLTAVVLVSFALPWLAVRSIREAGRAWRTDPRLAYTHLDRARRLNPLSERPDLVAGAVAGRLGDWPRMRFFFERALERKSHSWYAELQLGVVEALDGRPNEARAHLARARTLNPREPVIELVRARLTSGAPVRPGEIDRIFLRRVEERVR